MNEIEELNRDYAAGKFARILADLVIFVKANREKILSFQDRLERARKTALTGDVVIKMYVMQIRSINPAEEIRCQLTEIEREIWVRGETMGREPDRGIVAREWCKRHAPGWRDHRVMEIVFVIDRHRDELALILRGPGPGRPG